jgi:general secretion pathway protein D
MTAPRPMVPARRTVCCLAGLLVCLATPFAAAQQAPAPSPAGMVDGITFPKTSVFEVLAMYESLTGKRIIRDSNLAGPELSIVVAGPMPKSEAIRIIESSLLLNGYSIVPVDDRTVKVLGPSRAPRSEGLPLYTDEAILPLLGDRVISFFKPLRFLAPADAIPVVQGVVQANAFGAITPAPSANAVIITDKTPVVEKALAVLELIDREPAQVVTRFVPLERANVEKVVEMLDQMFGTSESDTASSGNAAPPAPPAAIDPQSGDPVPAASAPPTGQYEDRILPGKTKFLADTRTNRILVITRAENFRYLNEVIRQLDAAGSFEQPYVRAMNYLSVVDAFPVLADMLAEGGDEGATGAGSPQATPQNPFAQGGGQSGAFGGGQGGFGSSGGGLSRPDRLTNEAMQTPPLSASLGNIRLIGDTSENTIIVYGPPDSKERAKQILELLDRRPRQVYLAAVIGQLRVGDDLDYGVSYLVRYQNFRPLRSLIGDDSDGAAASVLSPRLFPGVDILPDPSSLVSPDTFASLSGLTIYGSIAESVDVFARFLETTNRFQTLARPVVYTTNNKKATILSGQRVPVPTSTLTTATGGGITGDGTAVTSNIQYQDVVLKLEVIPLINSDDEVNLIIAQTNDSIIGFDRISDNDVPRIATQEITTSVRVRSGSTIVLGGLITDQNERLTDGIPFISRIPVIGPILGGSTSKSAEKSELIVMIQPIVVDSEDQMQRASMQEGMRTQLGSDAYELTARPAPYIMDAAPVTTPAPSPTPKKRSWLPWIRPKTGN